MGVLLAPFHRIGGLLVGVVLAGIVGLSLHRYTALEQELTESALARRQAIATLAATTFSEKLDRALDIGVSLATRVRFQELVAAGRWEEAAQILRRVPQDFAFVDRVFLAAPDGTLMADMPELPGVRGRNFAQRDWYRGVSRAWTPYVSTLYRREAPPQREVIAIAVPIRDTQGSVHGVLVMQVKLEAFFAWAAQLGVGDEGRVRVMDRDGRVAFDSLADAAPAAGEDLVRFEAGAAHGWQVVVLQPARAAFAARDAVLRRVALDSVLIAVLAVAAIVLALLAMAQRRREEAERARRAGLEQAHAALARQAERLRIVHDIDRAISAGADPQSIAAGALKPLRDLLQVPRVIVNVFDLAAGEVEWLAATGRQRTRVGPGVRYSLRLMGDVEALRRGETQRIDVSALGGEDRAEAQALLESGVRHYRVVPMLAHGELIGAVSFGGERPEYSEEQLLIAGEAATQLAIAIAQARLLERLRDLAASLERRVAERTLELQAANRELEGFSYSVSHDLRAPLRAIDGFARMLQEDYGERLDDEGRRLLGVVRANATRMGQLIDDLLAFSRVSRTEPQRLPVDMTGLAREAAAEAAPAAAGTVRFDELPGARGDRALLKQAWVNLVANACKFSGKRERPEVQVGGKVNGTELVYWVRDNGAGFDPRFAGKLFGVFQRLHRDEEFPGTGVGLAIVQRVVARHGGRVWAEGEPGKGACFYFSLPKGD